MNESGRKTIALVMCIICAAGAIASMDHLGRGDIWAFNSVALSVLAVAFLGVALIDGESGSGSRTNSVHNEIHVHGAGHGQAPYAPQPAYYPQPQMPPPQPQYVVLPSPAPAAPQFVMLTPEMMAQLQGHHPAALPPAAQYRGEIIDAAPGHSMQRLTAAPDGRYLAARREAARQLPAPQASLKARLARRLLS